MFFGRKLQRLAEEVSARISALLNDRPAPDFRNGLIDCYPFLDDCLDGLERRLSVPAHSAVEPPTDDLDGKLFSTLRSCLQGVQGEIRELRRDIEKSNLRLYDINQQLLAYHEKELAWEVTKNTLTEVCWELLVVDGKPDHPNNRLRWSKQFRELLGYSECDFKDDWEGYFSIVNPDDLQQIGEVITEFLRLGDSSSPYTVEYRMRHKSRGEVWFRERGQGVWDRNGQLRRIIGAVRDISDEKLVQRFHVREPAGMQPPYEQLVQVLSVIKSISDQTNVLALNTAIDAAWAGDMGRGFSLVADEVRKLADSTQEAIQTIQEMLSLRTV